MIKKFSVLCVYAVAAMMALVSCGDDDIKSFDEVETIQRGYFREVVKPKDVDRLFKSHRMDDFEYYANRWCALIGDSLEVFTYVVETSSTPRVELFKHGNRLKTSYYQLPYLPNRTAEARLKLDPDKLYAIYKDYSQILLPFIYNSQDRFLCRAKSDYPGGEYYYSLDRVELFKLNDDGSFFLYDPVKNVYYLRGGKLNATILPECMGDSLMSADRSLHAELDFEQDGEFGLVMRNPSTAEVSYEKHLFLTREVMQELRDNGGRVASKSLSFVESPGGLKSCFELHVLFPNGHSYKYRLNREKSMVVSDYSRLWQVSDIEIEYQGHSYTLSEASAGFSDLPCFVVFNNHRLAHNEANEGKFRELSLVETNPHQTWNNKSWRSYNGEDEELTVALNGYNYVVGQNNGLIAGYSSLTFYDINSVENTWYYKLLVYDEECPNCLGKKENGCKLSVDFDRSLATCPECKRVYDLNCFGVIHDGDDGKRLIRYRYIMAPDERKGVKEDGLIIYGG